MKRTVVTVGALLLGVGAYREASGQSPSVCDSSGGPTICVRFDNLSVAPVEGDEFVFAFDGNGIPSVELRKGTDDQTTREWRVWCYDGNSDPADIGSITAPGSYNYSVKLLNPSGQAGARNLTSAELHSTALVGSVIEGDLLDDLTVPADQEGVGGLLDLTIRGNVAESATISAQGVQHLLIGSDDGDGGRGDMAGRVVLADNIPAGATVQITRLSGELDLGGG